jgi:hypothetical protein
LAIGSLNGSEKTGFLGGIFGPERVWPNAGERIGDLPYGAPDGFLFASSIILLVEIGPLP